MSGNNLCLHVFLAKRQVATLFRTDTDELDWQYTAHWQQSGFKLSPFLPLNAHIPSVNVTRFLRNLLPEGGGFDELLQRFNLTKSNTFGLSLALGKDLPGALIVLPSAHIEEEPTHFRKLSATELATRLDHREEQGLIFWDEKPRLSVAGVQDKINLVKMPNGDLGFGEGDLCSTHILKFEKKQHIHLALNECMTLTLARQCGLNVASAELVRFRDHTALLVERFDRKFINDTLVKRRHMIDACQALNLPPEYKYEQNFGNGRDVAQIREGVSFINVFKLAKTCAMPAQTTLQLIDWALFNVFTFNFDAHGKNLSFFVGAKGLELTPFYDLVNIAMYPKFDQNMAMALGDEFDGHSVNAYQLAAFAQECQLPRALIAQRLTLIGDRLLSALPDVGKAIIQTLPEKNYRQTYQAQVAAQVKRLLNESSLIQTIDR